jgi:N4-gp56 family major capsid protein
MADAPTQFSTLSTDAPNVFIAKRMYALAEKKLQLGQFASKFQLEQRMSKTVRVIRYKRLNLPTAVLTEGGPAPDAVALAVENVDVTVDQWGIVVLLTDVALITTQHPALQIAIERCSLVMAEVLEREMGKTLLSGTNVFFGAAAANRAALDGSKKLATSDILSVTANLRSNGAPDFDGGLYGGVMPPQVEADIVGSDTTFTNAQSYAGNLRPLEYGEIGIWMGTRWVRGQFLPILKGVAAVDTSATTAEKSQVSAVAGSRQVTVVAREITTGYQRKVSVISTVVADTATVTAASSTNYVYEVYTGNGTGVPDKLVATLAAGATSAALNGLYAGGTSATPPSAPASGKEVFFVFVFGKDGFGRVELNGMSLESYITPAGASWANPLAQGRKVGSKIAWKSFLVDNSFVARVECNSAYSANLPA